MGRGSSYRWVKEVVSPGRCPDRVRSSTPSRPTSSTTPPPPGESPVRPRTPPGVFTQVQKNNGKKDDDDLSEDLFDDSFDINDIPEEMLDSRSNLTQIFPGCNMDDGTESASNKQLDDQRVSGRDEPDLLSKVLAHATTLEEDEKISRYDGVPDHRKEDPSDQQNSRQSQQQQQQQQQKPMSNNFDASSVMDDEGDWGSFGTGTSSRLTTSQVRELLRGLTPDPSITRSLSEGHQTSTPMSGTKAMDVQSEVPLDEGWGSFKKIVPTATPRVPRSTSSTTSYDISDNAKEIATAVRHARHAVVDIVDGAVVETGLERHDFPTISRDMIRSSRLQDQSVTGLEEEVEITIPEIVDTVKNQVNVTFVTGPVAKFILVARDTVTSRWSVPSRLRFHDVVNQAESKIRRDKLSCGSVLDWCSEWGGGGGVGLLGLRVIHPRELHAFRTVITEVRIGGLWYNTYPKDFLAHKTEVSVLLRQELRCLDLQFLPHSLFEKNSLLEGDIRVRYSRHRDERGDDPTVAPLLQDGGKVVILEVDEKFALSLQKYPNNYSFRLGSFNAKLRCESDIADYDDFVSDLESLSVNSSTTSTSTFRGSSTSSAARRNQQRMKWNRMALNSDSFQLPYPVPSVYREKPHHLDGRGRGVKVGLRGKGKSRGRRGSTSIKKSWNNF